MLYRIKKGRHNNNLIFKDHIFLPKPYFGKKKHTIRFRFDQSCVYNLHNDNQYDINKLWGYSFGHHHINSFRIGFNYSLLYQSMDIHVYWYNEGNRGYSHLCFADINEYTELEIQNDYKNNYIVITHPKEKNFKWTIPFKFPKIKLGYYLDLWIGGDEPAQQDMNIELTLL